MKPFAARAHSVVRSREAGFSLLELMIVLAIIGLITGAVGMVMYDRFKEGQIKAARLQVQDVVGKIAQFMASKGDCPRVEDLVDSRYLRRAPVDPWGAPIEIRCPGEHKVDPADVISLGPDKAKDTSDDIRSWEL